MSAAWVKNCDDSAAAGRLWSLWDMQEHKAGLWFVLGNLLTAQKGKISRHPTPSTIVGDISEDIDNLRVVKEHCLSLNLAVAAKFVDHTVWTAQSGSCTYANLEHQIASIRTAIEAELSSTLFFRVNNEYARYYQEKQLFGAEVETTFSTAIGDIEEAGKCLALGRGTACIFHLMRVMEAGLKRLSGILGIPYAPSWESHLNQIEARITAKHETKGVCWKRDEPLFRDLAGDLQLVKIVWRNPTMHIVRTYTQEESEEIFRAVRAFMKRLATQFPATS